MSITVYYGPMFSGKTTRLQQIADKYPPDSVLTLKPVIDDRYSINCIVSHTGHSVEAKAVKELSCKLFNSWKKNVRYVVIDEAHMFGDSLIPFILKARDYGIHVHIAAVDKVFDGSDFGVISKVIKLADWSFYKQGTCGNVNCANKSVYSHLKASPNDKDTTIIVGGSDLYEPLCADCFKKK